MGRGKDYTTSEIAEIRGYLNDGCSYAEIAELMGRTKKAIEQLVVRMEWTNGRYKENTAKDQSWGEILDKPVELSLQLPEQDDDEAKVEEPIAVSEEVKQAVSKMENAIKPVKEKTLDDFTPREIIRHMYNLGYRIENGKLVCIVHQVVNLKDIING